MPHLVPTLGRATATCLVTLALIATTPAARARAEWLVNGTPVCTTTDQQESMCVIADGSGGALLTWVDSRGGTPGIYGQRVDSNGVAQWTPDGRLLHAPTSYPGHLATLPFLGGAVMVWEQSSSPGNIDLHAQRIDLAGNALWAANGVPIATSPRMDEGPVLLGNGSSGAFDPIGFYVAWTRYEYLGDPDARRDILLTAIGVDGSPLWAGDVLLSSTTAQTIGSPVLAWDGTATIGRARSVVAAWDEYSGPTTGTDIIAQRVTSSGAPMWTYPARSVSNEAYSQARPAIATVGTQTVVVWADSRALTSTRIYAQRQTSSGDKLWATNGIPVCLGSTSQGSPRIVADNAGGTIVAWTDNRSGTGQPYAQRLDANGSPMWLGSGVPLCAAAVALNHLLMVPDGTGGAIVTWTETRHGHNDVYAQRIDVNGQLLWNPSGVPLCSATGAQYLGGLVRSGASGAIVGWLDQRVTVGSSDVYANRVTGGGGVTGVSGTDVHPGELVYASAHPARGRVRLQLALAGPADVSAEVLDVNGRRVRTDLVRATLGAGTHTLAWDGADDRGSRVPPGVYFVRVAVGGGRRTARVVQLD